MLSDEEVAVVEGGGGKAYYDLERTMVSFDCVEWRLVRVGGLEIDGGGHEE